MSEPNHTASNLEEAIGDSWDGIEYCLLCNEPWPCTIATLTAQRDAAEKICEAVEACDESTMPLRVRAALNKWRRTKDA